MLRTRPLLRNATAWSNALHHPDPLSPKQTQRFLDAVTTSFRKNLDQEHGWSPENERETQPPLKRLDQRRPATTTDAGSNVAADRAQPADHGLRPRPTDHHIASILSNPLFRPVQNGPAESAAKQSPMDVFDRAVSKGLMTLDVARGCLLAQYKIILNQHFQNQYLENPHLKHISDQTAFQQDLASLDVGDRVLSWLASSGMRRSLDMLSHRAFIHELIPFLVAEGKELVVWDWISHVLSSNEARNGETLAASLLHEFIQSKIKKSQLIDSPIESIVQASHAYRWHPRYANFLRNPWVAVSLRTTNIAPQTPPASISLFDAYIRLADDFQHLSVELPVAHLHLHHPGTPTHDRALKYFDDMENGKCGRPTGKRKRVERVIQRREAMMGFDTVNHLSLIGKFEEAESLMDFLKSRYRDFMRLCPEATLNYLETS